MESEKGIVRNFLSGLKSGSRSFGSTVTLVINTALLSAVYLLVVGPTALLARAKKKQFLDVSSEKKETYWEDLGLDRKDIEEYYKQF